MFVAIGCAMTLFFYKPLPFHFELGACNVVPLSWLASALINRCDAPSNPWSQKTTNVLEPHDRDSMVACVS
jgi:hypothetical protein